MYTADSAAMISTPAFGEDRYRRQRTSARAMWASDRFHQRHLRESDLSRARSLPRLYERRACFRAAGTGWDTSGEGDREKDHALAATGPSSLPVSNRCVSASPNNGEIRPRRVRVGRAAVVTHPARVLPRFVFRRCWLGPFFRPVCTTLCPASCFAY
ncbi:hypothetical protein MTO96_039300 [Rhipicephalus appendiculatus]